MVVFSCFSSSFLSFFICLPNRLRGFEFRASRNPLRKIRHPSRVNARVCISVCRARAVRRDAATNTTIAGRHRSVSQLVSQSLSQSVTDEHTEQSPRDQSRALLFETLELHCNFRYITYTARNWLLELRASYTFRLQSSVDFR